MADGHSLLRPPFCSMANGHSPPRPPFWLLNCRRLYPGDHPDVHDRNLPPLDGSRFQRRERPRRGRRWPPWRRIRRGRGRPKGSSPPGTIRPPSTSRYADLPKRRETETGTRRIPSSDRPAKPEAPSLSTQWVVVVSGTGTERVARISQSRRLKSANWAALIALCSSRLPPKLSSTARRGGPLKARLLGFDSHSIRR